MCHEAWVPERAAERGELLEIAVSDGLLPAVLHRPPPGVTVLGGCVVAPDIYGMVPFYREVARRLAGAGCVTALVDTFFREGPLAEATRDAAYARRARLDEERAVADTHAAIDAVQGLAGGDRVGVVGFCLGGLFALDLAADRSDLAAVSFYGFPEGLPGAVRVRAPRPIDRVDEMRSPVLAFWGDLDHVVPVEVVERFDAAMADARADYESHRFADAGHGFLQGLVEERADSPIAHEAWDRTIAFLSERLAGRSA